MSVYGVTVMDRIRLWWQDLEPREQLVVALGGGLIIPGLLYFLIIAPVLDWRAREQQQLQRAIANANEVSQLVARVLAKQQSGDTEAVKTTLSVLIDESLRERNLVMRGYQPGPNDDARLRLENADYSSLIQWLYDLEYRHGITIQDLSLTPAQTPGRLMASLRVSR